MSKYYQLEKVHWLGETAENDAYVINTIVEISRNIKGFKFVPALKNNELSKIDGKVTLALYENSYFEEWFCLNSKNDREDIFLLSEAEILPSSLTKTTFPHSVVTPPNFSTSIFINDMEHIRIRSVDGGFSIDLAYNRILIPEKFLESALGYIFDTKYGYLTSNILLCGTGLKIWVHLSLPMIAKIQNISVILDKLAKYKTAVFPAIYEGKNLNGVFFLTNLHTLGVKEIEIIENVKKSALYLIELEKNLRNKFWKKNKALIEDRIYRAYAIIKNARVLSYEDLIYNLSFVRMGVERGIFPYFDYKFLDKLSIIAKSHNLKLINGKDLALDEEQIIRAKEIQRELNNWEV